MTCFADINVSRGSVATYARCGGIFSIRLTIQFPRNLSVKKMLNRFRFDRFDAMSLWPHFFGPPCWPIFRILSLTDSQKKTFQVSLIEIFTSYWLRCCTTIESLKFKIRKEWHNHFFLECYSAAFQQMCIMFKVHVWNVLCQLQCRLAVSCAISWLPCQLLTDQTVPLLGALPQLFHVLHLVLINSVL